MPAAISSWNFTSSNQKQSNATVTMSTLTDVLSKPIGLSFRCSRYVSWVDPKIKNVYDHAIQGQADVDMKPNSACPPNHVMGECGNRRGASFH